METPPFDRSLELHHLDEAAANYASRYGEPRSADYRTAWVTFRQGIDTAEDLRRRRAELERAAESAADLE